MEDNPGMPFWRSFVAEPSGAIPTRRTAAVALGAAAAGVALYLALGSSEDPAETQDPPPPATANVNPGATVEQAGAALEDAADRQLAERAAAALVALEAERSEREDPGMQQRESERQQIIERRQAIADIGFPPAGGRPTPGLPPAYLEPGAQHPPPGQFVPDADAEFELRQRRAMQDSLSSPPVALSVRGQAAQPAPDPFPAVTPPAVAPATVTATAPASAPAATRPAAGPAPPSPPVPALPAAVPRPDLGPDVEVIDEGAIADAVMLTEIRADFAGPVQAMVNMPLWSRDRQRVLVPRGTKVLGSAGPVEGWGQSRLAVSFHRLILPSGERVELSFRGLSQTGASSLRDQVNRHYLSTFGAAGAVGLVAGLSQIGAQRPSLATPGDARFMAGQRMGEAAGQVFERFLNRPPTIRIRPGHRVRIYFTTDAALPRRFPPG